jgi:hypothetical protein
MRAATGIGLVLAGYRYETEHALAALRIDHRLDDREKSRRITQVIEAANARAVELLRRRGRLTLVGSDIGSESWAPDEREKLAPMSLVSAYQPTSDRLVRWG